MRRAGGRGGGGPRGASSSGGSGRGGGARRTYSDVAEDAVKSKDAAERKLSREGSSYAATARDAFLTSARDLRAALDENTGGAARHWIANPRAAHDATLALGESLALAAAADVVASRVGPLTPQLVAAEADAKRRACLLYRDAATALDDLAALGVASADQPERPDFETHQTAVVGAANALAAWGDLLDDPREAAPVLERAERRYETAANAELARLDRVDAGPASSAARSATFMSASADALAALWNLADARVKRGECAGRLGDAEAANALFDSAFRTYEAACGRADSAAGDDLGGLLHLGGAAWSPPRKPSRTPRAPSRTRTTRGPPRSAPPRITRSTPRRRNFDTRPSSPRATSRRSARRVRRRSVARNSCFACLAGGRARVTCTPRRCTPWRRSTPRFAARRIRRAAGWRFALRVDSKNNDANVGVA